MLQIDIDIAMAAQKRRIPFMFVRNKADQASGGDVMGNEAMANFDCMYCRQWMPR